MGLDIVLTIVDDYTRDVWVYLVKTQDEVYNHFANYTNLVLNQFKCGLKTVNQIMVLIVNNKMCSFFDSLGIVHQISCAYTPQQNWVAESKHKPLLNVARSLLFQSGIPLKM